MANSDSDKVFHKGICGHQFSSDARWPWTARKVYYERKVRRSGGKAVSCIDCGAGTNCRNLGYLNREILYTLAIFIVKISILFLLYSLRSISAAQYGLRAV